MRGGEGGVLVCYGTSQGYFIVRRARFTDESGKKKKVFGLSDYRILLLELCCGGVLRQCEVQFPHPRGIEIRTAENN